MVAFHHAEIKIDIDLERREKGREQMFVLAGRDDDRLEKFLSQLVDDRRKLDRLGPRPKQDENLHPPINRASQNFSSVWCHSVVHKHFRANLTKLPKLIHI